ncbi:hypothetical protein GCM10011344_42260 [Dokdonia pacifica]|uniref:Patatin-like phospholipase n=1 Tax=Dokdonia pacifica TaxID=1627892 RepID=A0A239DMZ8_9FLAO|nr:hypothetical protein [Dokdonia pacifica]GGG36943.1 hypothetical protein GCM10011344_42260 [Dokdonia pacifica]SNS33123.1 hypothetical protein SAMN06265376_11175 [Dokdonia pacifica]
MGKLSKFIEDLGQWITYIIRESSNHMISIVIIFLLLILLWFFPQTRDLLLVLNQPTKNHLGEMILFFSSLAVLAFLISNVNDYFYGNSNSLLPRDDIENAIIKNESIETYRSKEREDQKLYIRRVLPKVLGTFLILLTAFSVNNIGFSVSGDDTKNSFYKYLFIILSILLVLTLNLHFTRWFTGLFKDKKWANYAPITIAIICLVVIMGFGFFNKGDSDGDVVMLFVALLLFALFFFVVSVSYSKPILLFKEKVGGYAIALCTMIAFIAYITFLISPKLSHGFNPLSIVLISFIGIFSILTLIRYLGKVIKTPLVTLLTIFIFIWSGIIASNDNFKHYEVSNVAYDQANYNLKNRPQLEKYMASWIEDRIQYTDSIKKFPVIFVAAEGGGSRAGLWSLLVNSYLYEKDKDYFEKHLLSLTGASGGNVGNSIFYTTAYQNLLNKDTINFISNDKQFTYKASDFYQKNFLSSSVASFLGRDMLSSLSGISLRDDRAKILENEWETTYEEVFHENKTTNKLLLSSSFLSLSTNKKKLGITPPLLLVNTTHLQSGNHSTISNVIIDDRKFVPDITKDFLADYKDAYSDNKNYDNTSIKISTAMLLNARFPYVSPAGRVTNIGQFADAGYYDNIGSYSTHILVNTFKKVVSTHYPEYKDRFDVRVLIIANNPHEDKEEDSHDEKKMKEKEKKKEKEKDTIKYSSQLQAPINTILSATFAHPNELIKTYEKEYLVTSKKTDIYIKNDTITPILPLGRYLSDFAILSLEERLKNQDIIKKLDNILSN